MVRSRAQHGVPNHGHKLGTRLAASCSQRPSFETAGTSAGLLRMRSKRGDQSNKSKSLAPLGKLVDLSLRELAVADDAGEMILDLAHNIDGLPQPLARIGVAELGDAPFLDVTLLEPREGLLQELIGNQRLRAGTPCEIGIELEIVRRRGAAQLAHDSALFSHSVSHGLSRNTCVQPVANAPTMRSSLSSSASA